VVDRGEGLSLMPEQQEVNALLEALPPTEWIIKEVPVTLINFCHQQRYGVNLRQTELDQSVERGMINPVNFTIVRSELLKEYVDFTNHTWGAEDNVGDFVPYGEVGDAYILLIAGHSRLASIKSIAAKTGEESATIIGRYHEVSSVSDIINLH
jgi:hypothetical protein